MIQKTAQLGFMAVLLSEEFADQVIFEIGGTSITAKEFFPLLKVTQNSMAFLHRLINDACVSKEDCCEIITHFFKDITKDPDSKKKIMNHRTRNYSNYGSLQLYNSGRNQEAIIKCSSNKHSIFNSPSSSHHVVGISDIIRGYINMGYSNNGFDAESNVFSH